MAATTTSSGSSKALFATEGNHEEEDDDDFVPGTPPSKKVSIAVANFSIHDGNLFLDLTCYCQLVIAIINFLEEPLEI